MNEPAVAAVGGPTDAVRPSELAPGLRTLLAQGVVRHGPALVFSRHAGEAPDEADPTGWECARNSVHLGDVVPVHIGSLPDGGPVIDEADQVVLLRHGVRFALEVVRLVRALPEPVPVRCIVSANNTNGTFRFHRIRPGGSWLAEDLDAYRQEKLIVLDS